jgi:AcrR family transcriptional regulator
MLSIRNAAPLRPGRTVADNADRILTAAASCVTDFGVDRVTLAEIARRAGVSRPTVYRRWPDARTVLAALLTRRVADAVQKAPAAGASREQLVQRVVAVAESLRRDDVVMAVLRSELAVVYIAERLGTSQHMLIDALAAELRAAQQTGSVRRGDPRRLAAMVLLITQSSIQSAQMVRSILDEDALAAELTYSLNGYLS